MESFKAPSVVKVIGIYEYWKDIVSGVIIVTLVYDALYESFHMHVFAGILLKENKLDNYS